MAKICAREECSTSFHPLAHNQKYCSVECRNIISDEKIKRRYYRLKQERPVPGRKCKECGIEISRYNKLTVCSSCEYKLINIGIEDILKRLNEPS